MSMAYDGVAGYDESDFHHPCERMFCHALAFWRSEEGGIHGIYLCNVHYSQLQRPSDGEETDA